MRGRQERKVRGRQERDARTTEGKEGTTKLEYMVLDTMLAIISFDFNDYYHRFR